MDGQLDTLEQAMSKQEPIDLFRFDGNLLRFVRYGSTAFLTLDWIEGRKMPIGKFREYREGFANALTKLKHIGIEIVCSACTKGDKKALKFNTLFGLSPIAETETHTICRMELR